MIPVEMTGSTCQCGSQITEETIRNIVREELENQK
jgi:hypothetical protein